MADMSTAEERCFELEEVRRADIREIQRLSRDLERLKAE